MANEKAIEKIRELSEKLKKTAKELPEYQEKIANLNELDSKKVLDFLSYYSAEGEEA